MKKRNKILITIAGLGVILICGIALLKRGQPIVQEKTDAFAESKLDTDEGQTTDELLPTVEAIEEEETVQEAVSEAVLATRRMVLAHNSLRAPSVADPDSVENKIAMQSMIFKALESKEQREPIPPETHPVN